MLTENDHTFYHRISLLQRAYSRALARRLGPLGVRTGYISIFESLWKKDDITQKELHATLDIEQATLSNTLNRMERDGFLVRKRNPKDRRMIRILLTDQGKELNKVIAASIDDVQTASTKGLTVNDRRYFYRVLNQIAGNLDSDSEDADLILVDEVID